MRLRKVTNSSWYNYNINCETDNTIGKEENIVYVEVWRYIDSNNRFYRRYKNLFDEYKYFL